MSDTKIIHVDDKYQTVRVNNFLLSYGINNNELHDNEEYNNNVNREPTADEYQLLYDANNAFFQKYFESYCAKHKTSANNTSVQYSSQVQSVSYKKDKIPNDNYQVCVKYSYADMKYPINSNLTDELEVMAEGILAKAVGGSKYIEEVRKIGNGETPFHALENVYFKYCGRNEMP